MTGNVTIWSCKAMDLCFDKGEWISDLSLWPDISFGDIWTYLMLTPGVYTAENMKAYKSFDGYNFFTCGKVKPVLYYTNEESVACILRSTVQPSQSHLNDKKSWHHPWVLVNKSTRSIIAAHCTCKTGWVMFVCPYKIYFLEVASKGNKEEWLLKGKRKRWHPKETRKRWRPKETRKSGVQGKRKWCRNNWL